MLLHLQVLPLVCRRGHEITRRRLSHSFLANIWVLIVVFGGLLGIFQRFVDIVLFAVGPEAAPAFLFFFGSFLAESLLFLFLELLLAFQLLLVLFRFLGADLLLRYVRFVIFLGLSRVLGLTSTLNQAKIDF